MDEIVRLLNGKTIQEIEVILSLILLPSSSLKREIVSAITNKLELGDAQ